MLVNICDFSDDCDLEISWPDIEWNVTMKIRREKLPQGWVGTYKTRLYQIATFVYSIHKGGHGIKVPPELLRYLKSISIDKLDYDIYILREQ